MVWIPDDVWYAQQKAKGQGKKVNKSWGAGTGAAGGGGNQKLILDLIKALAVGGNKSKRAGAGDGSGGKRSSKRAFSGDFVKGELIKKIKEFQKSGEEQKQTWWAFCDSQGGGNRDPARHETEVLQGFLAEQGIQGVQGNAFLKSELVNKIKAFQRSSEEQKQAWWDFCDGQEEQKRDPAFYDAKVLQKFLAEHGIFGIKGDAKTAQKKSMLVAKIKTFQKSGEDQKQAWWAVCDATQGQKRDPMLHDVDFLQAFVNEHGI